MNAIDEITIDTITDNSLGIKLHIAKKTIKDENHFIPFTNPELLTQHLLNFLNQYGKE